MGASVRIETRRPGRPSNLSAMSPEAFERAERACDELMTAWEEMVRLRSRLFTEDDSEYQAARESTVNAMRAARAAGLTWRLIAEATGISHASAYAWWKRHGQ